MIHPVILSSDGKEKQCSEKLEQLVNDQVETTVHELTCALESEGIKWGQTELIFNEATPYLRAVISYAVNEIIGDWNQQVKLIQAFSYDNEAF
ncbi:hypothetical protein CBE89_00110 [Corynebacterium striatum]|uniref:Uncharacterized protein n=1 Tax=Corynebacterium striatum TaxID=43770 RepID=A0A2Z2IXF8_CORST|nr:hypothetical protein [Corynebacterium striatum]ART20082.1 hypothetical protein CBE89_00110 [Corynebacterium striatum]